MARSRKRKVAKPVRKPPAENVVPSAGRAAARVGPGSSKARLAEVAGAAADPEWAAAGKDMAEVAGIPAPVVPLDTQTQKTRSGRMGKMYEPGEELMPPPLPVGKVRRFADEGDFGPTLAEVAGVADPEWVDAGKDVRKLFGKDSVVPRESAPAWVAAGQDMNKVFQPAGKDLANPDDSVVRAGGKRIGQVGREVAAPKPVPWTAEQLGQLRDIGIQRAQERAQEAAEALGHASQRATGSGRRVRRSGPTLQDELARYNGRVWDPVVERWLDHSAIVPTPACVHFNIDNVITQLGDDYDSLVESGQEIFARHGVPFWTDERPVGDPTAWSKAFFTTLREQYPRPSAPYGECWLEYGYSDELVRRCGCHLTVTTTVTPHLFMSTRSDLGETSTYVNGVIYLDEAKTGFPTFIALFVVRLDANGEIVGVDWDDLAPHELGQSGGPSGGTPAIRAYITATLRAVLLTLSLCNARNIRQQVVREAKPASKKQRNAKPLVEVREIRIDGTMTPSSNELPKTHRGPVRAHKVRAHWRRYGPKYGTGLLFGRYEALIFQPAGRRGLEALGVVDQRYRVIPRKKDAKDQQ